MTKPGEAKILAVIPAYNADKWIVPVIQTALEFLPVLVVDDGSTDNTASVAEAAGAEVMRQAPNQGKGRALKTGFTVALERGYDAVVTLDADGQHDPHEIPAFLAEFRRNQADLIIGRRNFNAIPIVRRISNSLGTFLFSRALGQFIPDNQSGYRMISRRLLEASRESREEGYEFEVEMIVTCVLKGYPLGWVPINTIYANEKSNIQPLRHLAKFLQVITATGRRVRAARKRSTGNEFGGGML